MWTKEQMDAIHAREGNLIVSASAGSGKTAVLVERVMEQLCDPVSPANIDRFLIVTFTNPAAAEIREKLSSKLAERLQEQPENLHLQRQRILINRAKISTISAFCLNLVRQNFQLADLPSFFRIGNESELVLIREKILYALLEELHEKDDADARLLTDQFSKSRDDRKTAEVLAEIYKKSRAFADPFQWYALRLKALQKAALCPVFETDWGNVMRVFLLGQLDCLISDVGGAVAAAQEHETVAQTYEPVLECDRAMLENFRKEAETADYEALRELFASFSFLKFPTLKNDPSYQAVKGRTGKLRDGIKNNFKKLAGYLVWTQEEVQKDFEETATIMASLFRVLEQYEEKLEKEKLRRAICDFSDLERHTFRLLTDSFDMESGQVQKSTLAKELSEQFDEIFIDEYQDTNQIQDLIFASLSQEHGNLFMVGDVKQSIYRFRLAMPEIFLEKSKRYPMYQKEQGQRESRIVLPHNFRSQRPVVDFANFLFRQLMTEEFGDTGYAGQEELVCGAPDENAPSLLPELCICTCPDADADERICQEAHVVAEKAKQLLQAGDIIFDKKLGAYRPFSYGDAAVLMLYPSRSALTFAQQLRREGVPAICEASREFLATYEISTILSFLRVIDNPYQDVELVAILKSPLFCFTPDQLAGIRIAKEGSLFGALKAHGQEDEACAKMLETLERYRLLSSTLPVHQLIWTILTETSFFKSVAVLPDGASRQENLRLLYEYAKEYEKTSFQGLFHFNLYIRQLMERGEDFESAGAWGRGDCIRIMSIHKSKGLEFPVCFLSCLAQNFNRSDARRQTVLSSRLGIGFKLRDTALLADFDTFARQATLLNETNELLSEQVRVLYVALTRARQALYLTAAVASLEPFLENAASLSGEKEALSPGALFRGKNFLSWLLLAVLRHPDAEILREKTGISPHLLPAAENIAVTLFEACELSDAEATALTQEEDDEKPVFTGDLDVLGTQFHQTYPADFSASVPTKVTVTELVKEDEREAWEGFSETFRRPEFILEGGKLSAAERGTAMHAFFQYANIFAIRTQEDVEAEKARMLESVFLTQGQVDCIPNENVLSFCKSETARLFRLAPRVEKERAFNVMLPAEEVFGETAKKAPPVLLQGVIDCIAICEDGLYLLDYKTDRVQALAQLRKRYEGQLALYARAAEEIYGKPVVQKTIYSFHLQDVLILK